MTFANTEQAPEPITAEMPVADWAKLASMIMYRRPHGSRTESKFINRFLRPLRRIGAETDAFGNWLVRVGPPSPRILWSAHTDTVHSTGGKQDVDLQDGILRLSSYERISNCLGADNTAGVWLLLEMIAAKVPGLYVFHRGEECGGLGSSWIAKNTPELMNGIDFAIAFDRRSDCSVITHQWGGRTCSSDFAKSVIALLPTLELMEDDGGTFTDTANYEEHVSECTNISVGFDHEHGSGETLDVMYLAKLREAVLAADWSKLVTKRTPGDQWSDTDNWWDRHKSYEMYGATHYPPVTNSSPRSSAGSLRSDAPWHHGVEDDDPAFYRYPSRSTPRTTFADVVASDPEAVADILEECGYTLEALIDDLETRRGGGVRCG